MNAPTSRWLDRAWRGLLFGLMTLFVINIGQALARHVVARRLDRVLVCGILERVSIG